MEYTPRMTENLLVARSAAAGSMVLLKNVNQTLPLTPAGSEKLPVAEYGLGLPGLPAVPVRQYSGRPVRL